MQKTLTRRGARTLVWIAIGLSASVGAACRSRNHQATPSASVQLPPAPPSGFRRIDVDGWSLAVPEGFSPAASDPRVANQTFLIHQHDDDVPGAPRVMLAHHVKPADYPSRAFGLTALEGLHHKPDRTVLSSRQHVALGVDVTDIEVLVGTPPGQRVQWRRLFVLDHIAYTLTYAVDQAEAERQRATALQVLDSLHRSAPSR